VVTGSPTLRTADGERVLRPWDIAWFARGPAGRHGLRNDTDEPARVVFFSTVSDPEIAVYPDEGKVGVIGGHANPNVETIRGRVEVR
jgi:uncharacterized cupin superfamily protein